MERLYTIGVYGFEAQRFFDTLQDAEIDLFLDLRRRRGVRGREYTFANANRLMEELSSRNIAYRHLIELAPEESTRELQYRQDAADRVPKRQRSSLAEAYVSDYTDRTLEPFDWPRLIEELAEFDRPALFCVERNAEACHRHLVAACLHQRTGIAVTHLTP